MSNLLQAIYETSNARWTTILIHTKTKEENKETTQKVTKRIKDAGLKLRQMLQRKKFNMPGAQVIGK